MVGISTEPGVMENAAERLLGLTLQQVHDLSADIIFGQLRVVIATMKIEEINSDREKFLANVTDAVEHELKKIGLKLINVNVTDITDDNGYIDALGKEATSHAINEARKIVAEKERDGSIGEANAKQEQRVKVAEANAQAVEGENLAQITIAQSESDKRIKMSDALKQAEIAEKTNQAQARKASYLAEKEAELARAERENATQQANIIVPQKIEKEK
jgi:flotillin